jgi:hypothetical protein
VDRLIVVGCIDYKFADRSGRTTFRVVVSKQGASRDFREFENGKKLNDLPAGQFSFDIPSSDLKLEQLDEGASAE